MNNASLVPESSEPALQSRQITSERPTGIFSIWYRFTSPPEPSQTASFIERELFRRGRTGSQISIALLVLILISFPAAFAGSNSLLVGILVASLFVLALALFLNRLGQVNLAGILVVLAVITAPMANILTTPGGVNTSALPIFCILVLPLMCAVSFLPPGWVFIVAAINSLFTLIVLTSLPTTGELHNALHVALPGIVTPIILSQLIVAVVAYITARNARFAIFRADRAEEIATLEQREIERQQEEINKKQQLDVEIQRILQTHIQVANGNFAARAPLSKENFLWQIAYSLNNLLARLQGYKDLELRERSYQMSITYLVQKVQQAKSLGVPLQLDRTGTPLDALILELLRTTIKDGPLVQPPSTPIPPRPNTGRDQSYFPSREAKQG